MVGDPSTGGEVGEGEDGHVFAEIVQHPLEVFEDLPGLLGERGEVPLHRRAFDLLMLHLRRGLLGSYAVLRRRR